MKLIEQSLLTSSCQDLTRQGKILVTESSVNDSSHGGGAVDNDDDEYYDFWADEYDDYAESDDNEIVKERINFEKYGRKKQVLLSEDKENVVDGLPKNIYCDLVQTLNKKCVQTSLLGQLETV